MGGKLEPLAPPSVLFSFTPLGCPEAGRGGVCEVCEVVR